MSLTSHRRGLIRTATRRVPRLRTKSRRGAARLPNTLAMGSGNIVIPLLAAALVQIAFKLPAAHGATLSINVTRTLTGKAVTSTPLRLTLDTDTDFLHVDFSGPYFDQATNRVHLFLANKDHRITELVFTPEENSLGLYWAPYNVLRKVTLGRDGEETNQAETSVSSDRRTWSGSARVHRDFLPPRISRYNAAAVHPAGSASGEELQYDTLYSITNAGIAIPDLMVLPRYLEIGPRFLFDNEDGYSDEWKAAS